MTDLSLSLAFMASAVVGLVNTLGLGWAAVRSRIPMERCVAAVAAALCFLSATFLAYVAGTLLA